MVRPTYRKLLEIVQVEGNEVPSRYGSSVEVIGVTVKTSAGLTVARRGFNWPLAVMELLQVAAGIYNFDAIREVAPNADLGLFSAEGAYGPRMGSQLDVVVKTLITNPDTRQAVIFVGRPEDTCSNQLPCTETIQFLVRSRYIHCIVSMRSWDLVKGLPYDLTVFGGITMLVARALGLLPGSLVVTAGSGHIYNADLNIAEGVQDWNKRIRLHVSVPNNWEGIREWAHTRVHEALDMKTQEGSWMREFSASREELEDA
jgi:hypothetical protein